MKKKILFIIWTYTFGGGAESLLTTIVNHLDPRKYEISIIEYHHEDIKKEPVNERIRVLPHIQSANRLIMHFQSFLLYVCPQILINKYIKEEYDLYVSFNYLVPTFLLQKNTRNICWIHSDVYDLLDRKAAWKRKLQNRAFRNTDKIVAISDNTEKSLAEVFPAHKDKLVKIYNGVDIEEIKRRSREEAAIRLEDPSILFIGRLEERKSPLRLLHVLKLVHERGIKAHLYFCGRGEQEKMIIGQAAKYGLSQFTHMLGYQQNPFPLIRQCKVVSLLSRSEGFSMCLLECTALGKPFVASDVGGACELSDHQSCGSIIKTNEEAADAICFWLGADAKEIEERCKKSIERFGMEKYICQIEELFDNVIKGT